MNPLTADRLEVAAEVAAATGWWLNPGDGTPQPEGVTGTVYPSPPPGIVTPCAVVGPAPQDWRPVAFGTWDAPLDVWLYAEGSDLEALEGALCAVAGLWPASSIAAPSASRYGGTSYLGAVVTTSRHVTIPTP